MNNDFFLGFIACSLLAIIAASLYMWMWHGPLIERYEQDIKGMRHEIERLRMKLRKAWKPPA
jgi:hypothetical protein